MTGRAAKWDGRPATELRDRWGREDVFTYGTVSSTNDIATELAEKGITAGTIVVAAEQSAGRGRSGHKWHSGKGGLYLSMVLRPATLPTPSPLTVLAGLSIVMELDRAFPGLGPRLKWPNDVYVDDRKTGGVLTEAAWSGTDVKHVTVGVGINVRPLVGSAPAGVAASHSTLDEVLGKNVELIEVADAVVRGLDGIGDVPGSIPRGLLDSLDHFDWLRDRRVRVLGSGGADEAAHGMSVGIAPDGALLFRPDRGALRRVSTATVEVE